MPTIQYALKEDPSKIHVVRIKEDMTCSDILRSISKKHKKKYVTLFLNNSEIDKDDKISDYANDDPDTIFVFSTDSSTPGADFYDQIKLIKSLTPQKSELPKVSSSKASRPPSSKNPSKESSSKKADTTAKTAEMTSSRNPSPRPKSSRDSKSSRGSKKSPRPAEAKEPDSSRTKSTKEPDSSRTKSTKSPRVKIVDLQKTTIKNASEAGIETKEKKQEKEAKADKFTFYFTGGNKDMLLNGIEVELLMRMNPALCNEYLLTILKENKIDLINRKLIVFLPGGLPFISGTLGSIYDTEEIKVKNVIYGVLTRNITDRALNSPLGEICNVNNFENRILMSPLVDSTERGISDIACLMGYLNHKGSKSDLLLRTLASVVHFPPMITSMKKIIDDENVIGRDVITVCSTLYTFFRENLPDDIPDQQVFDYGLRLCNLISHIEKPPEKIPLQKIERTEDDIEKSDFLSYLGLGQSNTYFWQADSDENFKWLDISFKKRDAIENAYNLIASFTPIAPLSVRLVTSSAIVKGVDHEYLFLQQSKDNKIIVIDPMVGVVHEKDVEEFTKEVNTSETLADSKNAIDLDKVKQIVMVNLDESKSMMGNLNGYKVPEKLTKEILSKRIDDEEIIPRFLIAFQLLTIFANKLYAYRIPCVHGIKSFNVKISNKCKLTPLVPDFEKEGLKDFNPEKSTKLWDSIAESAKEIINFRKDRKGRDKYLNAISRILVISDGDDINSTVKVQDVLKNLIENKIIVDSIVISCEDESKMLSVVSHATGGVSYQVDNIIEALSLFENCSFLNVEDRLIEEKPLIKDDERTVPSKLSLNQITSEFLNRAFENATFDYEIKSKLSNEANRKLNVFTTSQAYSSNKQKATKNREKRILKELQNAINFENDDLHIFVLQSDINKWKVCFKGPNGTPYAKKWWFLYVTFPELYPEQPPNIRFISVPYHLNVSIDGRICIDSLYNGYNSDKTVISIIQEIIAVLKKPIPENPLQIDIYEKFRKNANLYNKTALKHTEEKAKNKYEDYIGNGEDEADAGAISELIHSHINPQMVIKGKKMTKSTEYNEDEDDAI